MLFVPPKTKFSSAGGSVHPHAFGGVPPHPRNIPPPPLPIFG